MREQGALKDSISTNSLEARLVQNRKQDQDQTRNKLLETEEIRKNLKKALMGVQPVNVPVKYIQCRECSSQYEQNIDKCQKKDCGSTDLVVKQHQTKTKTKWVQTSEKQLVNQKGFDMIWSEVEASVNENVTGSYLPAKTIERLVYSTCGTLIMQIYVYPWRYGIQNTEDAKQVIDIVRKNVLATANKARGGRALKSQEKTVVEKISHAISGGEDTEDDSGVKSLF